LAFRSGRLAPWEGQGFYVTTGTGSGPSLACGVCSSDCDRPGRTGILYHTFVVPPGAGAIRFAAAAVRPAGCAPGPALDVTLEAGGGRKIARQTRTADGWQPAPVLLPPEGRRPREYLWPVADLVGQTVRIVLLDADGRPGCHVYSTGFRAVGADEVNGKEFARHMVRLMRDHDLGAMEWHDSRHFTAIGDAPAEYTGQRLYNCETIYALFFDHF